MTADPKLAYTRQEAAERVGLSVDTIRRAINAGQLKAKRVGRHIRVTEAALREWFDGLPDA